MNLNEYGEGYKEMIRDRTGKRKWLKFKQYQKLKG